MPFLHDAEQFEALFRAVREACSMRSWSKGVEIVRAGGVHGAGQDEESLQLRVRAIGRQIAHEVILYPEDEDWQCDCPSDLDACEHVAAAVVATRQARKSGQALPEAPRSSGRLVHRLHFAERAVDITRLIERDGSAPVELTGSLASYLSRAECVVTPSQAELTLDRWLVARRRAIVTDDVPALFALLSEVDHCQLDGNAVTVRAEPVLPTVSIRRAGRGLRLVFEADANVRAGTWMGVGRTAEGELVALGEIDRWGVRHERLPAEQVVEADRVAAFMSEALPALRRRYEVTRDDELPELRRDAKPRICLDVTARGPTLSVLATLVYGEPVVARVDGDSLVHLGGAVPQRDRAAERRLTKRLREDLDLVVGRREDKTAHGAVAWARALRAFGGEVRGGEVLARFPEGQLELAAKVRADGVQVECSVSETDASCGIEDVIEAWQQGHRGVALDGGGYAALPEDWLERYGQRVMDLLSARGADGGLAAAVRPALLTLADDLEQPRPVQLSGLAPLVDSFDGLPSSGLPSDVTATLRDYQRRGVDWLCFLRDAELGALLADDMGLGKTLQTLCALTGRTLVVAPTSVMPNWRREAERFRPSLRVGVYHGEGRKLKPEWDLTLTTYALLRRDIDLLSEVAWDGVVLDEAQAIKNPETAVAQAAFSLKARQRIAVTGTPVENRLDELWSQMHFANPGLLGTRSGFDERYAQAMASGQATAAQALRARIRPFVLRRRKQEVAPELPPRTERLMFATLDESEREQYEALRLARRKDVVERLERDGNVMAALEALLRLRQMACHPGLVPGGRVAEDGESSKTRRLRRALDTLREGGHKALVFSQWTGFLDRLETSLSSAGHRLVRLDGSTRDRDAVVQTFQGGEADVMLISLKAGGTGLNLTAADHVFLMDPWWNPAVEDQAADRAHRIGQDKPVMVHRLVAEKTVEERMMDLQSKKRGLADAALGQADQATSITRQDLLDLLS